jgi:predicted transcriptional regulator YdeE
MSKMNLIPMESFNIIGISVRTDNSDITKLTNDMQNLWNKFISENIMGKIPNKIEHNIYCIYTDYEGDYTKPYTALLGCKVESLDELPTGLIGKTFKSGTYNKFTAKGNLSQGVVAKQWKHIWDLNLPRSYMADFEVYGEKSQNFEDAEVDIFIGVNK